MGVRRTPEEATEDEIVALRRIAGFDPLTGKGRARYVEMLELSLAEHYQRHYEAARKLDDAHEATGPLYWIGYLLFALAGIAVALGIVALISRLLRVIV